MNAPFKFNYSFALSNNVRKMGLLGSLLGRKKRQGQLPGMMLSGKLLVEDTYSIAGMGIGLIGTITYGRVKEKDTGSIGMKRFTVRRIELDHRSVDVASAGNRVNVSASIMGMPGELRGRTIDFFTRK